ncbi:MAG: HAMP domain-containing sensor histidine kinase [Pseudomonadota bacterium]
MLLCIVLVSAVLGLAVGLAETQWRAARSSVALQTSLDTLLVDLNKLVARRASSERIQSTLNGFASGAGLEWLTYRIGEKRWDVLSLGAETIKAMASDQTLARTLPGSAASLETRMPDSAPWDILWPVVAATFGGAVALLWLGLFGPLQRVLGQPVASNDPVVEPVAAYARLALMPRVFESGRALLERVQARAPRAQTAAVDVNTEDVDSAWEVLRLRQQYTDLLHNTAEKVRRAERKSTLRHIVEKVCHEVRNPMASMQTTLTHIQLEVGSSSLPMQRATRRLERDIGRIEYHLGDLLQFSDAYQHRDEVIDVADALHRLARTLTPHADISVRVVSDVDNQVQVDAARLNSALMHVYDNALLAVLERIRSDSTHLGEVVFRSWSRGGRVLIAVDDNGVGLNESEAERVFEPLYTTRPKGFGLGLAMTKRFVDHYGGSVRAVPTATGTRVELSLPCRLGMAPPVPAELPHAAVEN